MSTMFSTLKWHKNFLIIRAKKDGKLNAHAVPRFRHTEAPQEERGAAVQASSRALEFTVGKTVRRFIVEAGRLDNIVTN